MGKRGPKPRPGMREPNGRLSRTVKGILTRDDIPHKGYYVYFATAGGYTKIGYSGNVHQRMMALKGIVRAEMRLTGLIACRDAQEAAKTEKLVHMRFRKKRYPLEREWFDIDDYDLADEIEALRRSGYQVKCAINPRLRDVDPMLPRHEHTDVFRGRGNPWA